MRVPFAKYQGLGNDFVVIRAEDARITAAAARRLCDRRRGIGADGVLTVHPPRVDGAKIRMHVFNADGSEAEMCGNGLRCVVRFDGAPAPIGIDTDAGLLRGWIDAEDDVVGVTMGNATLLADRIAAPVEGASFVGTGVSMGNPHLVLDPFDAGTDLRALAERHGPALERHDAFPDRTNVGFCRVREDGGVDLVVFERGSGITQACGTGASAAVAALARADRVPFGRPVTVHLLGGPLAVQVDPQTGSGDEVIGAVTIIGEGRFVFEGYVELSDEELR